MKTEATPAPTADTQTELEYTIYNLACMIQEELDRENYSTAYGLAEEIKDLSK